ncbi:LysM domain-containing protein [Alicyclobacillus sp. SO9]|uniref:LysM peptidoglycan-binding domain-containing protein n=1 Tax=Alicyclobacillus sp. SO9 TaxID=2665646 RepID=UPI0018E75EBC|nr:LysM domain-containing protein [Alicyclobacillus sp. SO9]QQE77469.1 LysM peptidoglycan-binding domain-containing protein [Alicyclobacillus sp. SO9]
MKKYIVKDGDTMWSISKKTGIRLNLLVAANPQIRDPNQLQPGSVIMIPELTKSNASNNPVQPESVQKMPVPKAGQSHHHVQKGTGQADSPVPPYFGFVWPHVVKAGETWTEIADKYGISSSQLQHLNPKESPGTLDDGDIVYVPAFGFDEAGSHPAIPYPGMHPQEHQGGTGAPGHAHGYPAPSPWPYGATVEQGVTGYPSPYAYPGAQYPGVYPPQTADGYPGMPQPSEYGMEPGSYGPHTHMPPRGDEYWWRTPQQPGAEYPYYGYHFYNPYLDGNAQPGYGFGYTAEPGYRGYASGTDAYHPYGDGESFPEWGMTDFTDVEVKNYDLSSTKKSHPQSDND